MTPKGFATSPPLLWRVRQLVLLPHVGDAHVQMEPVHLLGPQVAEAKPVAGHVLHFVTVHYLLDDALKHTPHKNGCYEQNTAC